MQNFKYFLLFMFCAVRLYAQDQYSNYSQQTSRIQAIGKSFPQYALVKSIGTTAGGKELWMITIGTGNNANKPAIAVIGGVEGNHLLGMELALGFAENLLRGTNTDSIKLLLSRTTYYVFPNMMPDAMETYFSRLRYERTGNATETDDDRDGALNEDGYEDLDGNGKITLMRVESPIGQYRTHPDDPRVLIKTDIAKKEKGKYLLYTEGIDNDKDGSFNEDGPGGVVLNKNLTFKHPSFTPGSGEFPVSEKESRALLDQLFELFNVHTIVSFGFNNNLTIPLNYNAQAASQRIVAGYQETDAKMNALVSELYNEVIGVKDAPKTSPAGGDLLSWGYYHYGRNSFSTPGWWLPKTKPDTAKKEKAFTVEDDQANYLRWSAQQQLTAEFTTWKAIQHPDFPGQVVEVGGIDPFALLNPPYKLVPAITQKHTDFLIRLAAYQPDLDIVGIKSEKLGNNVVRITANILNKGALASHTNLGERSYWVKRIAVKLTLASGQTLISGKKNQLLNSIEGFSTQKLSWLVKGNGTLSIEAGSPATGTKKVTVPL